MNIAILCNRDLASNFALNLLLPRLVEEHRLRVFYSSHVGGGATPVPALALLRFFEQSLFNELFFPALEGAPGRPSLLSFNRLATQFSVPVVALNQVNSDASLATLAADDPDLVISIRYGGILRERAIATPALGVVNLHSGLLPDYRGVMATFRAMAARENLIGTTLHTITDPGIDTGDIIATSWRPVDYDRSYLWNVLQLYPQGVELVCAAVATLGRGESLATCAQPAGGAYYGFPSEPELADFHRGGLKLYDVSEIIQFAQTYLSNRV
jgi:methionyl-tRNA formyltransferase